jgi:hypothetical protein
MPQLDKITFLTTIYWVFVSYFFLYLDFAVTYLYKFLTFLKFRHERLCWAYRKVQINVLRARFFLFTAFHNISFFIVLSINNANNSKEPDLFSKETFVEFCKLWPLYQWIGSLTGLVILYWFTGKLYNKWLSPYGGWLSWKTRILLIISDLAINLVVGMYALRYLKDTAFGLFMMKCPIAISPAIFLLELLIVFLYGAYKIYEKKDKEKWAKIHAQWAKNLAEWKIENQKKIDQDKIESKIWHEQYKLKKEKEKLEKEKLEKEKLEKEKLEKNEKKN